MTDISWHTEMQDCPNGETVLICYDDGAFRLIEGEHNDTPWSLFFPVREKVKGFTYPIKWAVVQ